MSAPLSDAVVDHLRRVAADAPPDLRGTRYRAVEPIGRGGMGTVWLARDRKLGRDVALKVLDAPDPDGALAARMVREARVLARLEHPAIVPVHDVGRLPDGRVFCAMKRVRGRRLDDPATLALPLAERLDVFVRLCEAVAFAHDRGVLHRDLKPANVMVGPFGEVQVMDWGLARVRGAADPAVGRADRVDGADASTLSPETTAHGTVLGTPGYMAPEQARGETDRLDGRSDVYALGALLHFLLAGRPPAEGEREASPRRLDPDVPRALDAVCARALAAEPGDRYADPAALAADVSAFLRRGPVSAYAEGPLERVRRLAVRHATPLLLVAAYLLMRVLLLVFRRG